MSAHIRHRSFCRYCGALTTYLDSCCAAHRGLLENELYEVVDEYLAGEGESLPTMADEMQAALVREDKEAARERGV